MHVRAEDGRGPLWWAYEHKREHFIDLLHSLGVDKDAKGLRCQIHETVITVKYRLDGDGLMAREMVNGPQASKFAAKLEKARQERQVSQNVFACRLNSVSILDTRADAKRTRSYVCAV